MSYIDLLERMKDKDAEAFLEMTDRYGWSVYSVIRRKYPDRAVADRVYQETMNAFYRNLSGSSAEDPLEALLCAFADQISPDKLNCGTVATGSGDALPKVRPSLADAVAMEAGRTSEKKGFGHYLSILMLLITIAALTWTIAGMLMHMGYIPAVDLGYSWVIDFVLQFF